jgi:hypothetical protein
MNQDRMMEEAPPETCPFENPDFHMDPYEPCPVCGDLGTFDVGTGEPSRCVS